MVVVSDPSAAYHIDGRLKCNNLAWAINITASYRIKMNVIGIRACFPLPGRNLQETGKGALVSMALARLGSLMYTKSLQRKRKEDDRDRKAGFYSDVERVEEVEGWRICYLFVGASELLDASTSITSRMRRRSCGF